MTRAESPFRFAPRQLAWLLVALAAWLAFAPALAAGWLWDDHFFFDPLAPALSSPTHVAEVFGRDLFGASTLGQKQHTYRPLTVYAWTWVIALTGGKAWALHAWSLLLHSAVSVMVVELALALGAPLAGATLAGLAFAASTAQTEAAVWISAVHGVAEAGFVLGAALATLRLDGGRRAAWAAACAAGALLCKESGLLAVLATAAMIAVRWQPGTLQDPAHRRGLVGLITAQLAVVAAYLAWRSQLDLPVGRPPFDAGGVASLAAALGRSLLLPDWPNVCRPLLALGEALPGVAGLLAASALVVWYSPQRRAVLAALALALATLLLLGPIAAQTGIASDRYLYLPQALWWAAAATVVPAWQWDKTSRRAQLLMVGAGAWLALRAVLAGLSVADMASDVPAFAHAVAEHPADAEAHYHLGVALLREHRTEPALASLQRGLELRPADPRLWSNLTGVLVNEHRDREAVELVARFETLQVASAKAAYNLALAASRLGDRAATQRLAERALALDPNYARARALLDKP